MRSFLPLLLVFTMGCPGFFGGRNNDGNARTGQCDFTVFDVSASTDDLYQGGTESVVTTIPLFSADAPVALGDDTYAFNFHLTGDPCGGGTASELHYRLDWSDSLDTRWWEDLVYTFDQHATITATGVDGNPISLQNGGSNPHSEEGYLGPIVRRGALAFGVDETVTTTVMVTLPTAPSPGDWIRMSLNSPIGWVGADGNGYPSLARLPDDLPLAASDLYPSSP